MSNPVAQLGSKPPKIIGIIFVISCVGLFIHGVTSSLLLEASHCSDLGRVADILLFAALLAFTCFVVARQNIVSAFQKSRRLQVGLALVMSYSAWIVLRGVMTHTNPSEILLALLLDTSYFWLFLLLVASRPLERKDNTKLLVVISLSLGFLALLASLLYMTHLHTRLDSALGYGRCGTEAVLRVGGSTGQLRSRGFARNPNELGALLVIPLLVCFSAYLSPGAKKRRSLLIIAIIGLLSLLVVTFSRSAWIAAFVAGSVFITWHPKVRHLLHTHLRAVIISSCVIVAGSVLILSRPHVFDRYILHKSASSDSTTIHLADKRTGLRYAWAHPWGTGPGSAGAVGTALHKGPVLETESAYLDLAAQYGFFGLALALMLFAYCLSFLHVSTRDHQLAVVSGVVGLLVCGLIIPVWSNLPVSLLFAIFVALAAGATAP